VAEARGRHKADSKPQRLKAAAIWCDIGMSGTRALPGLACVNSTASGG